MGDTHSRSKSSLPSAARWTGVGDTGEIGAAPLGHTIVFGRRDLLKT